MHEADDITPIDACAALVHEYYTAYMKAGFTAEQALWLAGSETKPFPPPGD